MKINDNWVEVFIDNIQTKGNWFTSLILMLVVLFVGAGSLYMLLNTQG